MVEAVAKLPDDHILSIAVRSRISKPNTEDNDAEFDNLQDLYEKYQAIFLAKKIKDYAETKSSECPYEPGISHAIVFKALISLLKDDQHFLEGKLVNCKVDIKVPVRPTDIR